MPVSTSKVAFSDLARAAYCPRQLYYARRADREPPPEASARIDLAFRYPALSAMGADALGREPVDRPPGEYRTALARLAERDDWEALCSPDDERVLLYGKD